MWQHFFKIMFKYADMMSFFPLVKNICEELLQLFVFQGVISY